MKKYPDHLTKLIETFKTLPGVGTRTAERFAFHLLDQAEEKLQEFALIISMIKKKIRTCQECGCLAEESRCSLCKTNDKTSFYLCVVSSPKDAISIEQTHEYQGLYHVIGGLLSPLEGRGPDSLSFNKLYNRIKSLAVQELILALDSTVEGDATAFYITEQCHQLYPSIKISRLAFGLPMGSPLDYVDGGTLARALSGRSIM